MSSDTAADATYCTHTDYTEGDAATDLPATGEGSDGLAADVWEALHDVDDPEMPVSIVDLGLIYGVDVDESGDVRVDMTLTYTGCPARDMLTETVEERVAAVDGVESVDLRMVWAPDWSIEMVTEDGREQLREFGLSI
ncbi:metal-sulfur cluster biosynthetic enzyme [Halobacteriales archaeon SW_5_70_135]|nr:MAG: metal-sulfur cluster biosynthetic enzyme [Halobacteriales archaeon SW_5_70_135]